MVHLRIVAPEQTPARAMERLCDTDSVLNVIRLDEPVRRPGTTVLGVQKRLYERRHRRHERELSATA